MNTTFWKHKRTLISYIISIVLIGTIVIFSVATLPFYTSIYPVTIIFSIFLLLLLFDLFINKKLLSKITFFGDIIQITRCNKDILTIKWSEIIDVKDTTFAWGSRYLTLILVNTKIDIELTQEIYDAIINTCPSPNLIAAINSIDYFKIYHKNK